MSTATQEKSLKDAFSWQDSKKPFWAMGLMVPMLPIAAFLLFLATGSELSWWVAPFVLYLIVPLLDYFVGTDRSNPPEAAVKSLAEDRYYRHIVYAYIPLQFTGTIVAVACIAEGSMGWVGVAGAILNCAYVNGIGINTAHELGHKREALPRFLAKLTLAPVAYGHFFVEHNFGHHRRVATPEDPASSRYNESFWRFLPRTVIGSLRSAWEIEAQRLARKDLPAFHWRNDVLQAWAMTVVLFTVCTLIWGWAALAFLVVQAALGASLLEVINYIEHYGLKRQKGSNGRYERCQPRHSWNSNHTITNILLYQLQRHSDHHANPTRPYQALRHFDDSPQLPSGYASMMMLAYLPPLWFRVMNPRVKAHFNGDLSLANHG